MDETAKNVQELKTIIREMVLELGDLKERVTRLEKGMQAEAETAALNIIRPDLEIIKLQGEGYDRLGMLYNDGYHVCPSNFGDSRQEECLFCLAFINKE
ncbi:MAG TPA: initiation control protein YabA [Syntrophomonas sp.]|nr:initiation control protein YabA [Syntrophomonas sp.]